MASGMSSSPSSSNNGNYISKTTIDSTSTSSHNESSRLPLTLQPKHYDLSYRQIDLEKHTFEGTVSMTGTALMSGPVTSIYVHVLELQVIKASLFCLHPKDDGKDNLASDTMEATEYQYNTWNQTCEIFFNSSLATGKQRNDDGDTKQTIFEWNKGEDYTLVMEFRGILNNQMRGLYRSTYLGMDGKMHTMATTQFEPTDARRAFPCLDEPALKATFQLSVTVPVHLQCISNTPMASSHTICSEPDPTTIPTMMKTITFQTTPKMSTYLVALIVGQFDGVSQTSRNIVTTVYTVPGKAAGAMFCLDVATRCLDLYQDLYGIPYPLTKSDLIAIPDFAAGAMENWGCVTYREAKVLVKTNVTSENTIRGIARTICHELAHQWFGNLVTMEWWTQLYLNEGMARFMEFVAIDQLFPDWSAWTEFVQSVYGTAMALDSMKTSHPVEVEVHHPAEIDSIFDAISYAKGASIIRMIASYIGMDCFFQGMRTYLTRHAYGNTVTNDLWIALEEISNKPIVEFMAPWTQNMGYPILELSDDGNIKLNRFLAEGPELKNNGNTPDPSVPWPVPVTVKVEGMDSIQGPWIINARSGGGIVDQTEQLQTKINEWLDSDKWFKLNVDQTAFFRVNYSPLQWQRLASVMGPDSSLSTTDRLGLISDCFAAGKAGYSPITDAFMLVEKFGDHETADYAVWQELSDNLSSLASLYRSERFYGKFQSFLSRLYTRQMDKLGWEPKPNESGRIGTLRSTVISMMGKSGNETIAQKSFDLFKASHDVPAAMSLSGDLRECIYRCALRHDEEFVFNTLKDIYENSSFPEEQRDCLAIMGCVRDPSRHATMLEYVFNSGMVRLQDISIPLSSLASVSDEGGRATWDYFQRNFDKLQSELNSGPLWPVCVGMCCLGLTTFSGADEVENFFDNQLRPAGSASIRLLQALEVIRTKACRQERDRNIVDAYFS